MKRYLSVGLILMLMLSVSSFASASSATMPDVLHDQDSSARYPYIPTMEWDWDDGTYTGNFDIVQATNTNYYFTANDDGGINYCISGTSEANKECRVETHCKTCGSKLTEFKFTPNDSPFYRNVTLASHDSHYVYFKIVAFDGGEYWSDNDFTGTIQVYQ